VTEDKFDPPSESARMKAFNAAIEVKMAAFDSHKQTLIAILHDAYGGGPKAVPFDEEKSWFRLETTAHQYFMQERAKQDAMSNANREARQRAIGAALKQARNLIDEAMLDEVGDDLFLAWSEKANLPLASVTRNDDGSLFMARPADEMFKKAVACLTDLETAANRAANEAHQGRGRPRGARVLPVGYIEALAAQYRDSTGARPVPGHRPFVQFVCAFLAAIGRANISEGYVVELIRDASTWATTHPNEWAPSPFSE
jgi:hypothetical protein